MIRETIRYIGESVDELGDGDQVYSIGLTTSAEAGDDTFAVIFSAFEPDADGEGYSLVVEPGQRCSYDCVEACQIGPDRFLVALNDAAARDLGLPRKLALSLELPESDVARLRRGLARVGIAVG